MVHIAEPEAAASSQHSGSAKKRKHDAAAARPGSVLISRERAGVSDDMTAHVRAGERPMRCARLGPWRPNCQESTPGSSLVQGCADPIDLPDVLFLAHPARPRARLHGAAAAGAGRNDSGLPLPCAEFDHGGNGGRKPCASRVRSRAWPCASRVRSRARPCARRVRSRAWPCARRVRSRARPCESGGACGQPRRLGARSRRPFLL